MWRCEPLVEEVLFIVLDVRIKWAIAPGAIDRLLPLHNTGPRAISGHGAMAR